VIDTGRDIFDRTRAMLAEWLERYPQWGVPRGWPLAAPFGFVERPPLRWRVSEDIREHLMVAFDGDLAWRDAGLPLADRDRLYSIPLDVDPALPPNSVVLDDD
jgi:hypothetical protein